MNQTLADWLKTLAVIVIYALLLALSDPAPAVESIGVDHHRERTMERYLTEDEQARLLDVLKRTACTALDRRDAAVIRALIHSGLRIGEFSKITVGQALEAPRTKYLFVPREVRKGGRRDHRVFVTDALRTDLRDLYAVRFEMRPGDCHADDALVIGRHGKGLTVRQFELRFKAWVAAANLPSQASPHWLRHTRAMNIMRRSSAKDPCGVVKAALGHESIRSTGVYTGTSREDVESALCETDGRRRISLRELRKAYEGRAQA